ncbi:hypothetical protein GALMADRAFT_143220 [Galerina marginata CBS 339.88]|uniref:Uncharacterized protein n=1 Tax=Galerina marginata (strain CBS 339.88) TaxID=685588 RepID=A0A067SN86_GALM3|nr:hypothetical protein GALMADRAFT_143220 [Galerina marginata CBS 339.88]
MHPLDDELIKVLEQTLHERFSSSSMVCWKCALLGVHAENIHLVDVPSIAGVRGLAGSASVNDLDVFLWLPNLGESGSSFVDLSADRYTYAHYEWTWNGPTTVYYTFIYYNQEVHKNLPKNDLIASILGVAYPWMGDMLVVKSKGNLVRSIVSDEEEDIMNILKSILTDGTLA